MQISVTHAACSLQSCRSSYRSRVGPGGRGLHAFRAQEFLQIQGQEGGSYMPSELQELVGSRVRRREGAASLQSCRSCIRSRVRREGAAYLQSCRSSCISRVRRGRGLHAFRAAGAPADPGSGGGRGLHAFRAAGVPAYPGSGGGEGCMPSELQELVGSRVRRREGDLSLGPHPTLRPSKWASPGSEWANFAARPSSEPGGQWPLPPPPHKNGFKALFKPCFVFERQT